MLDMVDVDREADAQSANGLGRGQQTSATGWQAGEHRRVGSLGKVTEFGNSWVAHNGLGMIADEVTTGNTVL